MLYVVEKSAQVHAVVWATRDFDTFADVVIERAKHESSEMVCYEAISAKAFIRRNELASCTNLTNEGLGWLAKLIASRGTDDFMLYRADYSARLFDGPYSPVCIHKFEAATDFLDSKGIEILIFESEDEAAGHVKDILANSSSCLNNLFIAFALSKLIKTSEPFFMPVMPA